MQKRQLVHSFFVLVSLYCSCNIKLNASLGKRQSKTIPFVSNFCSVMSNPYHCGVISFVFLYILVHVALILTALVTLSS